MKEKVRIIQLVNPKKMKSSFSGPGKVLTFWCSSDAEIVDIIKNYPDYALNFSPIPHITDVDFNELSADE